MLVRKMVGTAIDPFNGNRGLPQCHGLFRHAGLKGSSDAQFFDENKFLGDGDTFFHDRNDQNAFLLPNRRRRHHYLIALPFLKLDSVLQQQLLPSQLRSCVDAQSVYAHCRSRLHAW